MTLPFIPALVKLICPNVKIIVSLRNPVDRVYSGHVGDDFDNDIDRQLTAMKKVGLSKAPPLLRANVSDFHFQIPKRLRKPRNQKGKIATPGLFRGFYTLQLRHWLEHSPLNTSMKVILYEDFQSSKSSVLNDILDFVGAPASNWSATVQNRPYGPSINRQKQPMSLETRRYLQRFYKPHNDELADLLGEKWRGVWDDTVY